MSIKQLGPGKLIARAPNPGLNDETYYRWNIKGADWLVAFDSKMKVVRASYSSRLRLKVYDEVTLNVDSMRGIEDKLGRSSEKRGPTAGEGEYAFYSIVYYCGPSADYEIEFRTDRSCGKLDMSACLAAPAFPSLRVRQVTIQRRASS